MQILFRNFTSFACVMLILILCIKLLKKLPQPLEFNWCTHIQFVQVPIWHGGKTQVSDRKSKKGTSQLRAKKNQL